MPTLYVRIPETLQERIREAAWQARQSAAVYVRAQLEKSFKRALRKPRKASKRKAVRK